MRVIRTSSSCRQLVRYKYRYTDTVTAEELADLSGTTLETIEALTANGILQPAISRPDGPRFRVRDVRNIHQAIRLHRDLDVSWVSMPVVMDLLDRIDRLERELRTWRSRSRPRHRLIHPFL